ncbi:MAG: phosphoenolpyruvate--protein phosphotransferase [Negativicutes bacterium]
MLFRGIGAAPGLAVAKGFVIRPAPEIAAVMQTVKREQVEVEVNLFRQAVEIAAAQLGAIMERARKAGDEIRVDIIGAQRLMLTDPTIEDEVRDKIITRFYPAVRAVSETIEEQAELLSGLEDPYLRERAADVRDIGYRLTAILQGTPEQDLSTLAEEVILVGREITTSQMASIDATKVKGIVAEVGGKTSHTAILANNMGIPAVLGCAEILEALGDGELLFVDGDKGLVETSIDSNRRIMIESEMERRKSLEENLWNLVDKPTRTRDGFAVHLEANIMDPAGADNAEQLGADGIGLYRTEFLFMDRVAAPTEDEQYEAYTKVLRLMKGKPVIIRTLDIGGDKDIAYMNLPKEENPFLGYRAIRICLDDTELFMTQLRAILRAAVHGRARIMYPMIASLEEVRAANRILQAAKESLRTEGAAFDDSLQAGIMVEIPSAAVTADLLIREAAFFSIGSNDLTQYTLAVDRQNGKIGKLFNPFQPAVLRLIRTVIETANRTGGGKFAGMCGEMASDPLATVLLLGLGLTEFSVNPSALLKIKNVITSVDQSYAQMIAAKVMQLSTADEIISYLTAALPADLQDYL